MRNKYIALIPAYEPEDILLELVGELDRQGMRVVLVDDGSGSSYAGRFSKAASLATVLTHLVNLGKGQALKTGLDYIQKTFPSGCIICTVDADGQHRAQDALRLCQAAEEHPDTLVLGCRRLKGSVPLRSRFGNTLTRFVYGFTTGSRLQDTQTGLRAFSSRLIPQLLLIPGKRYEYEMNVLLEFSQKRIPVMEMEIDTIYLDHNSSSHFHAVRDSIRIYREILKFSASSFAGFLVDYTLYGLLLLATDSLKAANIGARIVSSTVNYLLNRKLVFKSQTGIVRSALQYFLLAAAILFGNTLVLQFLVNTCEVNRMAAKLFSEILFFLLSWLVQRGIIFRKKEEGAESCSGIFGLHLTEKQKKQKKGGKSHVL